MPVISVTESQNVNAAGELSDVYEVVFTIEGRDGAFTASVPKTGDAVADAKAVIDATTAQVNALYAL